MAARVVAGYYACTVITVYHPGPDAITAAFFDELTEVLDRAATLSEPIYVIGDFNIRLERADDSNVVRFTELLAGYGLAVRVSTPTHRAGGVLDVVITRQDLPAPTINVVDTGLSDHSTAVVFAVRPTADACCGDCRTSSI